MTVVNSPLAKLRVPEKTLDIIAPPSNGPGELRCEPAAPKLLAAARNVRSVLIGASRNLSRCSMRGPPSGSLAIHASAGPATAAPSPTIVANTKRMSRRAASALGTRNRSSARKAGCIQRLSMMAKIKGRTISLAALGRGQHRKNKKATEKECLRIGRQGHIRQQFFGRFFLRLLIRFRHGETPDHVPRLRANFPTKDRITIIRSAVALFKTSQRETR